MLKQKQTCVKEFYYTVLLRTCIHTYNKQYQCVCVCVGVLRRECQQQTKTIATQTKVLFKVDNTKKAHANTHDETRCNVEKGQ